ncbi:MAG: S9 family peptidase [Bacteroidales bacterium]|nr:S9 family peptidase [Bacteroidales bacterium]
MRKNPKMYLFVLFIAGIATTAFGQEKELKIEDYLNREVYPSRLQNLQWSETEGKYSYVKNDALIIESVNSKNSDTLVTKAKLNAALHQQEIDSVKQHPSIHWLDKQSFRFTHNNKIIAFDIEKNEARIINSYPPEAKHTDIHAETKNIAYTKGSNLFISLKGKEKQITHDTIEGISYGKAAHRREFGISKGTFWSPSGKSIAYYRMDERMVSQYPLVNTNSRVAETKMIRYPMAGMKSHQVKVGVYHSDKDKSVFLRTGEPLDHYLTNITWGPEEKYIYIAELNRDQDHLRLNKYNAETGDFVKTLLEEKNKRYVEPEHALFFTEGKKNQFIWFSERDGYQHLYLYTTNGKLLKQLTEGEWVVGDIIDYNPEKEECFFYGTKNSPLNRDVFSVNLDNGEIRPISAEEGTHTVKPGPNVKYFLDSWSSTNMGRAYAVLSGEGKKIKTIQKDPNPLENYNTGETTISTLRADDGSKLYYRMIKPYDFDSTKKYPVFIYVYGGPHAQLVKNSHLGGANIFLNYLASRGYIVFTLDNRGSANRGFEFESKIHRRLGELEVADQMKGVDYLKSLDYVDTTRIGVNGWSYGGFMTLSMLLEHPETFKAGCAGGPVTDWKYYEVMYGERYMDTPESNPEGYKEASVLNKASNLNSRLLIIHGTMDPTVVWQHSRQFVRKCVQKGKLLDYFIYPGHEHNVRGKDRLHLYKKITQYFEDHL